MKKPVLVAPRNSAREMLPGDDLDRLLASGSYVEVKPVKSRSPNAGKSRAFKARKRAEGCIELNLFLPAHVHAALRRKLHRGESMADCIARLLGVSDEKGQVGTHK